jgi:hypothetical protein
MALQKELKVQSIVILAQNFNPSVFNQHWLVSNNFLDEKDILPNSLFTPAFAQIISSKCNLLVLPEQLQFSSTNLDYTETNLNNCLIPILRKLQETPYKAVGINFNWFINDEGNKTICDLSRELFYRKDSDIYSKFDTNDARFGIYLSKDFDGVRLKLDIKPIKFAEIGSSIVKDYIQLSFNFHMDLGPDNYFENLIAVLKKWDSFRKESENLTKLL